MFPETTIFLGLSSITLPTGTPAGSMRLFTTTINTEISTTQQPWSPSPDSVTDACSINATKSMANTSAVGKLFGSRGTEENTTISGGMDDKLGQHFRKFLGKSYKDFIS